jgi:pyrimidine-nucleoside phosphorylase
VRAVDVIVKKREGGVLRADEIGFFVEGVTSGTIPDYQASAWLMAIVLRGMSAEETSALTDAMVRSGIRVDLRDVPGPKVDKHSTGGVGDKTSLIVAPVAAACGVIVPMMSGRGLGHTGGTLDKLEAIPGFSVNLSFAQMKEALKKVGCAMIGQTSEIAPADKKLYALRDVTGTVESIALISASIMSKKIAEGIDALVLDVKAGSGAFMKKEADARRLAESLVSIGRAAGLRTEAVITRMDAPLGRAVGNALEVLECIDVLKGGGPADLVEVSVELAARMLLLGEVATDRADAEHRVRGTLASGRGLECFKRIVEFQGGDPRSVDDGTRLPAVPGYHVVPASRAGYVTSLDAELVGRASAALGAGRDRTDDPVDPAVGISVQAKPGAYVSRGDPVLALHFRSRDRLEAALALATRAIQLGDSAPTTQSAILGEVR